MLHTCATCRLRAPPTPHAPRLKVAFVDARSVDWARHWYDRGPYTWDRSPTCMSSCPTMHLACGTKEEGTTTMALRASQLRGCSCTVRHLTPDLVWSSRSTVARRLQRHRRGWSEALTARVELANKVSRHVNSVVPRWVTRPVDNAELVACDDRACRQRSCAAGDHTKTLPTNLGHVCTDWQRAGDAFPF